MAAVLDIGDRRELFVDDLLIERLDNVRLRLHEPVSADAAIKLDHPWEGPASFGLSVIQQRRRPVLAEVRVDRKAGDDGLRCRALPHSPYTHLGGKAWFT
jgi:hypothetical protein